MEEPRPLNGLKTFLGSNYDRVIVTLLAVPLTVYLALDYSAMQRGVSRNDPVVALSDAFSKFNPMLGVAGLGLMQVATSNATLEKRNATLPPILQITEGLATQRVFCPLNESERWIRLTVGAADVKNFVAVCSPTRHSAFCQLRNDRYVSCPPEFRHSFSQLSELRMYIRNCLLNCLTSFTPFVNDEMRACFALQFRHSALCINPQSGEPLDLVYDYLKLTAAEVRRLVNIVFVRLLDATQ